jgi:hypothetical protein
MEEKKKVDESKYVVSYFLGILGIIFLCMGMAQVISTLVSNSFSNADVNVAATIMVGLLGGTSIILFGLILGIIGFVLQRNAREKGVSRRIKKINSLGIWGSVLGIIISLFFIIKAFMLLAKFGGSIS